MSAVGNNADANGAGVVQAQQLQGGGGFEQVAAFSVANRLADQHGVDSDPYKSALKRAWNTRNVASNEEAMAAMHDPTLAANTSLRQDEWKQLDDKLHEVAKRNLVMVNSLRGSGLTQTTDLGTLIHEWERGDEFGEAELDMGAETRSEEEEPDFDLETVRLPVAHKSFHVQHRKLLASRMRGQSIETRSLSKATRAVSQRLEKLVAYGWNTAADQGVYGLMNEPNANSVSASNWADTANVGSDEVRTDILSGIETLENDNYGPEGTGYNFFLARDAYQQLRARDTGTDNERGLLERINDEFGDIVNIIRADYLDDGEGVMFKPVEDVVELIIAADMQNVEWSTQGGWTKHLKVLSSVTPVVKSDKKGQSGIATFTGLTG